MCLFCGHAFCPAHRTERDGVACCTACNELEHARASGRAKVRVGEAIGTSVPGAGSERLQPVAPEAKAPPPPPLPEAGWWPLLSGLLCAAVAGMYLWWLTRWLGAPGYAPHAATGAGAALVFAGVWVIVKSKLS